MISVKDYEGGDIQGYNRNGLFGDEQTREIVKSVRREVKKLTDKWNELLQRSEQRQKQLDDVERVSKVVAHYKADFLVLTLIYKLLCSFLMMFLKIVSFSKVYIYSKCYFIDI